MKRKTVLKSLVDLSPKVFEPEPDRPAQVSSKPTPASVQDPPKSQFHILMPGHSGFTGYSHWGLNE
jgi:hypothetical protein